MNWLSYNTTLLKITKRIVRTNIYIFFFFENLIYQFNEIRNCMIRTPPRSTFVVVVLMIKINHVDLGLCKCAYIYREVLQYYTPYFAYSTLILSMRRLNKNKKEEVE